MKIKTLIIFLTLLKISLSQEIKFEANAPSQVLTGQTFTITYTLNENPTSFEQPDFGKIEIISGPMRSQSTSIQIIGGKMTQNIEINYTFYAVCHEEGTYTIPPASAIVKGKTIKSNPLTIVVLKGASQTPAQSRPKQNLPSDEPSHTTKDDIFLYMVASKNNVYVGEPLILSIYIYTRVGIVGFEDFKSPSLTGFWTEDLETPQNISLSKQTVNGKLYNVGLLKKIALIPQQSGKLTINPAEAKVIIQKKVKRQSHFWFDDFFPQYENIPVYIKSDKLTITVNPLPDNPPASFNGAIGTFSLNHSLSHTQIKTNEALTYTIKLSGKGNIKLTNPPKINFPKDFEVYEPKISTSYSDFQSGTKTFSYILIPRSHGLYTLPGPEFSYFDLSSKSYKKIKLNDLILEVIKDTSSITYSTIPIFSKSDFTILGKDIKFIKTSLEPLHPHNHFLITKPLTLISYPLFISIFLLLLYVRKEKIKEKQNVLLYRNKNALKIIKKRLKIVSKYLKNNDSKNFFNELHSALWKYLSDKLMIQISEINKPIIIETLQNHKLNEHTIKKLIDLLNTIELAKFAPLAINKSLEEIYSDVLEVMKEIEEKI